jgi:hypothetical protein
MNPRDSLASWVLVWALTATLLVIVLLHRRSPGAGLMLGYLTNLGMNHFVAGAIYLLPFYRNFDPDTVALGFQQSTFAVVGLAFGSLILAPGLKLIGRDVATRSPTLFDPRVSLMFILLGITCLIGLRPLVGRVPTITAFVSQGWGLLMIGVGLAAWHAWQTRQLLAFAFWVAAAACLPLVTIVTVGFIGFGTAAALAIMAFVANFTRPGWKGVAVALVFVYLGLSVYVTYMRDRIEIRDVVWTGGTLSERIERMQETFGDFEWFQLSDPDHLERIDLRLNQNILVGQAAIYLDTGLVDYARGKTLLDGLLALIPRAIWPTKPVSAGSGDVVSDYTGFEFAEGTSVGVGNVMEAYISFGTLGVIVAFIILGAAVAVVDARAGRSLNRGDWRGFVRWYLPGLSLLQVGGSFVELTASLAVGIATAYFVSRLATERRHPRPGEGELVRGLVRA